MFGYIIALLLGVAQGLASIVPVSDFGHQLFLAETSGWKVITAQAQADTSHFLTLIGMSQIAIGLMLAAYNRRLWGPLLAGALRTLKTPKRVTPHDYTAKLGRLLLLTGLIGGVMTVLFDNILRTWFGEVFFAIAFTILNGILLLRGDRRLPQTAVIRSRNRTQATAVQKNNEARTLRLIADHTTQAQALRLGLLQTFGLIPGISRSGILMLSGLRSGLDHEHAATFAWLMLSPILIIAGLTKLPQFFAASAAPMRLHILAGACAAGFSAVLGAHLFRHHLRKHGLQPIGFYCIGLGILTLILAIMRGSVQR